MDLNVFNSALQSLHAVDEGLRRTAHTVARANSRPERSEDINTALLEAKDFQRQGETAVKVVKAADETVGSLIDERV